MIFSENEIDSIRKLAACFEEGQTRRMTREWAKEQLGLDDTGYDTIMRTMEKIGAIEKVDGSTRSGYATTFCISPYAVQLARQIAAQQQQAQVPPDIVDQFKQRLHRNPKTAIIVIIALGLAIFIPLLNSGIELVQKLITLFSK